ncbi:DMT family transporter [Bacillaceae bacterium W0354]
MRLYSLLIALSLFWGVSFVFIKLLIEPAGIWGMVFIRCLLGSLILMPFLFMKLKKINYNIPWPKLILLGIINAGLPWGFIAWSETVINSNTTSVVNALTPLFTALVGYLFFKKKLLKEQWLGILIGFFGILILVEFQVNQLFGSSYIGVGTMMTATIFYGFGSQFLKKYLQHVDVIIIASVSLFVASMVGLMLAIITNELPTFSSFNTTTIIAAVGLGVFGSGLAHIILYHIIKFETPEIAATVTYMIPITTMITAYIWLKEPVSSNLFFGMLIILSGIYLTSKRKKT